MIESISFGHITINSQTYHSDLIIYPDGRIEDNWWMQPANALEKKLDNIGVRFIVGSNQEAMVTFNRLAASDKVGACFHLTC